MQTFNVNLLQPILKTQNEMSTMGLRIKVPSGDIVVVRGKLLFGVFDLPAKASVLCCKQFNGEYVLLCLYSSRDQTIKW